MGYISVIVLTYFVQVVFFEVFFEEVVIVIEVFEVA